MNNDTNIGLVLAAALRYSLGRRSYIVPTIQDFIRRHKDNSIIKENIPLYKRDIDNYLASLSPSIQGYEIDEWKKLSAELANY